MWAPAESVYPSPTMNEKRPAWARYLLRYLDTALKTLVALVTLAVGIAALVGATTSSPGKWVLDAVFNVDLAAPEVQVQVESPFSPELEAQLLEWLRNENAAREGTP
jgi:phosphatidate phosphatase APP1